MTFMCELDKHLLKMYLQTKNELSMPRLSKVIVFYTQKDKQTDRQTLQCDTDRQTPPKLLARRLAGGNNVVWGRGAVPTVIRFLLWNVIAQHSGRWFWNGTKLLRAFHQSKLQTVSASCISSRECSSRCCLQPAECAIFNTVEWLQSAFVGGRGLCSCGGMPLILWEVGG